MCFVLRVVFLLAIILTRPVPTLFSFLGWFLFSADHPLADILILVVSCKLAFGDLISVMLGHIVTRDPLLVFIGELIVDGGTSCIICEDGVSILLVVL